MKAVHTQYDVIAPHYDALIGDPVGMLDYYTQVCSSAKGAILEIGCGSGRLTERLERSCEGEIVAIDLSSKMVAEARKRVVRAIVEAGDMRTYRSDRTFDRIVMAGGVFEMLASPSEQMAALTNIRALLAEDGLLAFDINTPPFITPPNARTQDYQVRHPHPGEPYVRSWNESHIDYYRQIIETEAFFEHYNEDGVAVLRQCFRLRHRFTTYFELQHLLALTGWNISRISGNFDGTPYGHGSQFMIVEARRGH